MAGSMPFTELLENVSQLIPGSSNSCDDIIFQSQLLSKGTSNSTARTGNQGSFIFHDASVNDIATGFMKLHGTRAAHLPQTWVLSGRSKK